MIKKTLAGTAGAVGAAAVLGSVASRGVNSPWYVALDKPAIQPPGPVFPIVWTLLYSDIAISSAVVIDRLRGADPGADRPQGNHAELVSLRQLPRRLLQELGVVLPQLLNFRGRRWS